MIKTKSIFEKPDPSDGTRILISSGVSNKLKKFPFDEHIGELGPTWDLVSKWKDKEITWEQYTELFLEEMRNPKSIEKISQLAKRSKEGEVITLLCWEKETNPCCHRHIIKEVILEVQNGL